MSVGRSMVGVKSLVVTESAQLELPSGQQIRQVETWMVEMVPAGAAVEFVTEWVVASSGGPLVGAQVQPSPPNCLTSYFDSRVNFLVHEGPQLLLPFSATRGVCHLRR